MHQHLAADALAIGAAEHAHRELGAARAHQARDADDLALAHAQAHAVDLLTVGMLRMVHAPVAQLEHRLADPRLARRIAVRHVAPHHAAHDAVFADGLGAAVHGLDRGAIAQHGDRIGHLGDLVELVRDQDRCDALALELEQQPQQRVAVGLVEARGGLVEDQQAHLLRERLGDLHQLLLAHAEVGHQRGRGFLQAHLGEQLARPRIGREPVDHATARDLVAEEDVLGDRQQRHQRELLVDDDDAELLAVGDAPEAARLALEQDLAVVRVAGVDAAEHLHQRGLASAVLAHHRVDLARAHREVDVAQRLHAREGLGDPAHLEDRAAAVRVALVHLTWLSL
ncbi:MAG: hypothetical protein GAK39_05910 [Variovorax sp.]|nr:MAG: hypothetical protein GAK39_05910 [Variovorax sp.]